MTKFQKQAFLLAVGFVLYRLMRHKSYDEFLSVWVGGMFSIIAIWIATRPKAPPPKGGQE